MQNKFLMGMLGGVVFLICLYSLSFNYVSWQIKQKAMIYATHEGSIDEIKKQNYLDSIWNEPVYNFLGQKYTYQEVKQKELNLGLDLQGGMFLILEVSPYEIIHLLDVSGNNPLITNAIEEAKINQKTSTENPLKLFYKSLKSNNPDLHLAELFANSANRDYVSLESSDDEVLNYLEKQIDDAVNQSFIVLRNRIDRFGVSQPNIQRLPGTNRIQIELAGIGNPNRVRKLLQGIAKLEFVEVAGPEEYIPVIKSIDNYLVSRNILFNHAADTILPKPAPSNELEAALQYDSAGSENHSVSDLIGLLKSNQQLIYQVKDTIRINKILNNPEIRLLIPEYFRTAWQAIPEIDVNNEQLLQLYVLKMNRNNQPLLTGEVITDARQDYEQAKISVSMKMNAEGAQKWRKITKENIGNQIAIVLDNNVYSAPVVQSEIPTGNSSITGNFTLDEAKDLANILNSGKMPAKIQIVEESVIGPSLGIESIQQGLISIGLGLVLIILFMVGYYGMSGFVANIALTLNIFLIIGTLTQFGAALTLPGMAGLLLTLGMAVDANVLIYERIREELNHGKSVKESINVGFRKAYSSILDSNITTFLTGLILYIFGNGGVKGFALILMIGIIYSLFTAVFISRIIFEWMIKKNWISVRSFSSFLSTNIFSRIWFDFVGHRKIAYAFSISVITVGIIIITFTSGLKFGVDFKGGRSYVVKFDQPLNSSDIKDKLIHGFESAGVEVKTYGSNQKFKITTSYLVDDETSEADQRVENELMAGLNSFSQSHPTILSSVKVGATIADDIRDTANTTVVYSLLVIFLYILMRFRKWQYGVGAIIALIHDVLMVISLYGIVNLLGLNLEVDQVFIAAILTIIGYSINDTVVVFDRIREFYSKNTGENLDIILNKSINNTLSRTVITSFTVFMVVLILLIFGGESLRGFSFALLVGVIFGTFSSIFIASPIVLDFQKRKKGKVSTIGRKNAPRKMAA